MKQSNVGNAVTLLKAGNHDIDSIISLLADRTAHHQATKSQLPKNVALQNLAEHYCSIIVGS